MAAVLLETTELERILEAGIQNRSVAFTLLNKLRVKNGKAALNSRFVDLSAIHPSVYIADLAGVQADLDA